jgi:hypothetical protein
MGFRIYGPAEVLLGFSLALPGQLGGNVRFVLGWDLLHKVPARFRALIPGDHALRTCRNFRW